MITDNNTANTPASPPENTLDTIAKNRNFIPLAFALVIIFFFFSFCDFKCNSMKVASLTGINLVTGTHIQMDAGGMLDNNPFNSMNGNPQNQVQEKGEKVEPNIWAILALLAAIGGVIAFYKKIPKESLAGTAAGIIGFISLLILRSAIKNKVSEQGGGMVQVEIDFLFGYWASLLAFIIAGGISYLRLKQEKIVKPLIPGDSPEAPPITPLNVKIITQDRETSNESQWTEKN
jgi:hypothetical protein